ncbi:MAG TPA: hypothetical protein VN081_03065 [Dongiaceae bacterium]|nr:hypothetical protein [Dongiaceae bacterium]
MKSVDEQETFLDQLGIVFDGTTVAVCKGDPWYEAKDNLSLNDFSYPLFDGKEVVTTLGWGGSKALNVIFTCIKRLYFTNDYALTLDGMCKFLHRLTTFDVQFFELSATFVVWVKGTNGIELYKFELGAHRFVFTHLENGLVPFTHLPRANQLGRELMTKGANPIHICRIPFTTKFGENKDHQVLWFNIVDGNSEYSGHWYGANHRFAGYPLFDKLPEVS